jgi:hypothetical protein
MVRNCAPGESIPPGIRAARWILQCAMARCNSLAARAPLRKRLAFVGGMTIASQLPFI